MSLYDNEENAIVNNANDTSETPSNLVNESPDQEYNKNGAKLSPNPAGFGFVKQLFVTPENTATNGEPNLPGEPNVLYLVQVLNNGVLVGYRKYKWTPSDGFVQFGASPDLKLKDSPRETPTRVENEPKKNLAQVFNGDVAVNGDLFVNGQKIEKAATPLTPSEVVDIVNEGIEGGDIEVGTKLYYIFFTISNGSSFVNYGGYEYILCANREINNLNDLKSYLIDNRHVDYMSSKRLLSYLNSASYTSEKYSVTRNSTIWVSGGPQGPVVIRTTGIDISTTGIPESVDSGQKIITNIDIHPVS